MLVALTVVVTTLNSLAIEPVVVAVAAIAAGATRRIAPIDPLAVEVAAIAPVPMNFLTATKPLVVAVAAIVAGATRRVTRNDPAAVLVAETVVVVIRLVAMTLPLVVEVAAMPVVGVMNLDPAIFETEPDIVEVAEIVAGIRTVRKSK